MLPLKLLAGLGTCWVVVSVLVGGIGQAYLHRAWIAQVNTTLQRDAAVAAAIVESRPWKTPVEADPGWAKMEQQLDLSVLLEDKSPEDRSVAWSPAALGAYRISTRFPVSSPTVGDVAVHVTREVAGSSIVSLWWSAWGALNGLTGAIALFGWWRLRREAVADRKLVSNWVEASEASRLQDAEILLADVEAAESSLGISLVHLAESANSAYRGLRLANDRSELVFGNLREGVLAVDDNGQVLLANKALCRLLDVPQEAYLHRPLLEVVRAPVIAQLVKQVLADQSTQEEEGDFGDQPRYLKILARPLPLGSGRSGALITVRDETLLRRAEFLRRDFVANASHELKTPLAAIRAYAETLQLGALDDREAAESFVGTIISQTDRIDGLVQGMLQLSRVEVGAAVNLQTFNPLEAMRPCIAAAEAVARAKGVRLNLPEDAAMEICSDRDGFQTIVSNLLSNAVRYTESGGAVFVKLTVEGEMLVLEVKDTGIGMKQEDLERVFERFYRVQKDRSAETGGTGLGLSIVKHLTQALGGSVSVDSKPNQGSRFQVVLPIQGATDGA